MRQGELLVSMATVCIWLVLPVSAQAQRGRQPVELPDGPGRELVQTACSECHRLNLIVNSGGYTQEGWNDLSASMVELPADQGEVVTGYLATHFPVRPATEAVLIPGETQVSIREWLLPSLGSRPHDPLAARDVRSGGLGSGPAG